MSDGIAK